MGRTGSGKSSLLLTLLHLLDVEAGRITIDGIDMTRLPRRELRSRIIAVPQDPVEVPGSVRFNLTLMPECSGGGQQKASDKDMTRVLMRVGLWEAVSARGGLDGEMGELGLSGGQRQMFSLARAVLAGWMRKMEHGLVLLDEPTSSVDGATELNMAEIVRDEFRGCTVVTITHRLGAAVADNDVVVRMAGGKVVDVQARNS